MTPRFVMLCALVTSLAACTWVPIEAEGKAVRVLRERANPASEGCSSKGEIEVSVKDQVGVYRRNPLRVQEELETLARNGAPALGANTVQPLNVPINGKQSFQAWQCPPR